MGEAERKEYGKEFEVCYVNLKESQHTLCTIGLNKLQKWELFCYGAYSMVQMVQMQLSSIVPGGFLIVFSTHLMKANNPGSCFGNRNETDFC